MTQWFEDTISRIRQRYELTPEELVERLIEAVRQGPKHQDPDDRQRPVPGDTPQEALLRYRSLREDQEVLRHALSAKRQYMVRQWPKEASENDVFWMEKSLWDLDDHLDLRARSEYEVIKCLTREDTRPEHIEVLMELFFTPSLGFSQHANMLEFLLELQTNAWEEHFLISLERLDFDQIRERSSRYFNPVCEHCHAFADTERVKSLLFSWRRQLLAGIESANFPSTGPSPETALEKVREALAKLEMPCNGQDKTEKDSAASSVGLIELVRSRDLSKAKALLIDGADVNQTDDNGNTALHFACSSSQLGMFRLLLANRADVNAKSVKGITPLHCSTCSDLTGSQMIAAELLAAGARCDATDEEGDTPLHAAARCGSRDVAEILLEHGANANHKNEKNETPLHYAAKHGHQDTIALLISSAASVTATDSTGWTALHYIAIDADIRNSHYYTELAAALLDSGAEVNAPDDGGITPLHLAAYSNGTDVAEVLLNRGASPNAVDTYGRTPLHLAVGNANTQIVRDVVKLLVDRGANPDLKGCDGKSPTELAADIGHMPLLDLLRMTPGTEPSYRQQRR